MEAFFLDRGLDPNPSTNPNPNLRQRHLKYFVEAFFLDRGRKRSTILTFTLCQRLFNELASDFLSFELGRLGLGLQDLESFLRSILGP